MDKKSEIGGQTPAKPEWSEWFIKLLAGILKELGLPSFLVFIAVIIFLWYGTDVQKVEFIDRFILLKNPEHSILPSTFVVIFLILIYVLTFSYQRWKIKTLQEEIDRISKEKSLLQETLLDQQLRSSK